MAQEQDRLAGSPPATSASYPPGTAPERIRRDIEQTRAEMDETVNKLGERIRPRHLLDDLLELFRGSSAGQATSGATDKLKSAGSRILDRLGSNPVPTALIGAGVAWLLFENQRGRDGQTQLPGYLKDPDLYSGSYVDARTGRPYDPSYGAEFRGQAGQQPGLAEKAQDKLAGAAEAVNDAAESARDKAAEWTGSVRSAIGDAGRGAREYASSASEKLQRGYDTGKHYLERGLDEYPLAMGAAAMALGVLTGLLLPETHAENRLMGEASDEIKDRAREAGQSVASAAASAVSEEAGRQGIHPGELGEKVRHIAEDVKDAASESARREGLDPQSLKGKAQAVGQRVKDSVAEESRRQAGQ